ncbi:MAG: hypothetical protein JWN32_2820 [Solirubrobacterales bacterium]|jgi:hypothetical protein|nr:hypothetical protein [Solirubrobacterales bacterium]
MDPQLVLLAGVLHLLMLVLACVLLIGAVRAKPAAAWQERPPDEGDDGGSDRLRPTPPTRPRGGIPIPLPDAVPARVRLREPARLADLLPGRERRPAREPERAPARQL